MGYDKDFGGVSKVVFGGMIDRIDHIQMAFDLKKINIDFCTKNRICTNKMFPKYYQEHYDLIEMTLTGMYQHM